MRGACPVSLRSLTEHFSVSNGRYYGLKMGRQISQEISQTRPSLISEFESWGMFSLSCNGAWRVGCAIKRHVMLCALERSTRLTHRLCCRKTEWSRDILRRRRQRADYKGSFMAASQSERAASVEASPVRSPG